MVKTKRWHNRFLKAAFIVFFHSGSAKQADTLTYDQLLIDFTERCWEIRLSEVLILCVFITISDSVHVPIYLISR